MGSHTGHSIARSCILRIAAGTDYDAAGASSDLARAPHKQLAAKAIVFEMDNVLHDATVWRRWLVRVLAHLGVTIDYRTFYRAWDHDYLPQVFSGRRDFEEAFQGFLLESGLTWQVIDELEGASRIWRVAMEADVRPLPQVASTLARLTAANLPLAILANSAQTASCLSERLMRMKLHSHFSAVISSLDLEAAKPSSACYHAALAAIGCSASEAVYVGYDKDALAGAAAVGMQTVGFNHQEDAQADELLSRFDELLDVVDCGARQNWRKAS